MNAYMRSPKQARSNGRFNARALKHLDKDPVTYWEPRDPPINMKTHPERYVHMVKSATRWSISRYWSLCAQKLVRGAIGRVVERFSHLLDWCFQIRTSACSLASTAADPLD